MNEITKKKKILKKIQIISLKPKIKTFKTTTKILNNKEHRKSLNFFDLLEDQKKSKKQKTMPQIINNRSKKTKKTIKLIMKKYEYKKKKREWISRFFRRKNHKKLKWLLKLFYVEQNTMKKKYTEGQWKFVNKIIKTRLEAVALYIHKKFKYIIKPENNLTLTIRQKYSIKKKKPNKFYKKKFIPNIVKKFKNLQTLKGKILRLKKKFLTNIPVHYGIYRNAQDSREVYLDIMSNNIQTFLLEISGLSNLFMLNHFIKKGIVYTNFNFIYPITNPHTPIPQNTIISFNPDIAKYVNFSLFIENLKLFKKKTTLINNKFLYKNFIFLYLNVINNFTKKPVEKIRLVYEKRNPTQTLQLFKNPVSMLMLKNLVKQKLKNYLDIIFLMKNKKRMLYVTRMLDFYINKNNKENLFKYKKARVTRKFRKKRKKIKKSKKKTRNNEIRATNLQIVKPHQTVLHRYFNLMYYIEQIEKNINLYGHLFDDLEESEENDTEDEIDLLDDVNTKTNNTDQINELNLAEMHDFIPKEITSKPIYFSESRKKHYIETIIEETDEGRDILSNVTEALNYVKFLHYRDVFKLKLLNPIQVPIYYKNILQVNLSNKNKYKKILFKNKKNIKNFHLNTLKYFEYVPQNKKLFYTFMQKKKENKKHVNIQRKIYMLKILNTKQKNAKKAVKNLITKNLNLYFFDIIEKPERHPFTDSEVIGSEAMKVIPIRFNTNMLSLSKGNINENNNQLKKKNVGLTKIQEIFYNYIF